MNPVATIVVPLLRQNEAFLEQAVRSALTQTAPCEVIVVTSLDTPQSNLATLDAVAQEFENLRLVRGKAPNSFPGNINTGIDAAVTGRIGLLLSDDWLEPGCVEACLSLAADIVSTGVNVYHADGRTELKAAGRTRTARNYESLPTVEAKASYLGHFLLFRKHALVRAGCVDETIGNFPGIDDYHLLWTMLEHGACAALLEERLYNMRDHEGERLTLADPGEASRNMETILRKHSIQEPELSRLLALKSRWFGKPLYQVLAEEKRL